MILIKKPYTSDEFGQYYCDLTEELDKLSGINNVDIYGYSFRHYIFIRDKNLDDDGMLAIRVPGGTIGEVELDKDHKIVHIGLDTNYIIKTYPKDLKEQIKKYIGKTLEFN